MHKSKKYIFVQFQKEGIHCYPEAATDPNLATGDEYDVSFLATPHRHMFHFRISLSVTHDNRDVEFIQFKRWLESLYKDSTLTLNYKSCEMMGEELYSHISAKYPNRDVRIEISEDGENGCSLEFSPSFF